MTDHQLTKGEEKKRMNKNRTKEREEAETENDDGRRGKERKERFSRYIGDFKSIKIKIKE